MCRLKGLGERANCIPASSGVRLPFRLLQLWQQATRFSQAVSPRRERVAREPRLNATAIQTVGGKGYDGLLIALVE